MKRIWTSELSDLTPGAEFLILHKVRVLGGEQHTVVIIVIFANGGAPRSVGITEF